MNANLAERSSDGGWIRLRVAGEGAQALARQQVRVRRPVEQALEAVEPVPRRRFVAPGRCIDEVERRLAASPATKSPAPKRKFSITAISARRTANSPAPGRRRAS